MPILEEENYRVLSIQSHMVSGYCGNKAAAFPLQTLGFDVDMLNTVQFSNHTGYPSWTGNRLSANDVQELFDGLEVNGLTDEYTHVLTGYIGNYAILEKIKNMVEKLKKKNPNIIYVCDTVMGDGGSLYVAPEIVPLYRNIISVTDVITPNQFEAETLSGQSIESLQDTISATKKLHELGATNVIITTLTLPLQDIPVEIHLPSTCDNSLYCFTSQQLPDGTIEQHLISFPTYTGYFTGTGDLFSSLVVARLQEAINDNGPPCLINATYRVVCSVNAITKRTWLHQKKHITILSHGEADEIEKKPNASALVHKCELALVKGKKDIEEPERIGEGVVKYIKLKDCH